MAGLGSVMTFFIRAQYSQAVRGIQQVSLAARALANPAAAAEIRMQQLAGATRGYAASAIMATTVMGGLGMVARKTLRDFAAFEDGLRSVELTSGASAAQMAKVRSTISNMVGKVEFSPVELVGTMRTIAQAGFTVADANRAISISADLATASFGELKLDEAADLMINVSKAFGMSADETARAADKLVRVTQVSPLSLRDLSEALGYAAATAVTFNQDFDTTLTMIGMLIPITKSASKAGTAIRAGLGAALSSRGTARLAEIGVSPVDAMGNAKDALDLMYEIRDAVETRLPRAERQLYLSRLFGARGLQLYAAAMTGAVRGSGDLERVTLRGRDAVAEYGKVLNSAAGSANQLAQEQRTTLLRETQRLSAALTEVSISVGEGFTPPMHIAVDAIVDLSKALSDFLKFSSGIQSKLVAIGLTGGAAWMGYRALSGLHSAMATADEIDPNSRLSRVHGRLRGHGAGADVQRRLADTVARALFRDLVVEPLPTQPDFAAMHGEAVNIEQARYNTRVQSRTAGASKRRAAKVRAAELARYVERRDRRLDKIRVQMEAWEQLEGKHSADTASAHTRAARQGRLRAFLGPAQIQSIDKTASRFTKLGVGVKNATAGFANLVGPIGAAVLAVEAWTLAVQRFTQANEELGFTEGERRRKEGRREEARVAAMGDVKLLVERMVAAGLTQEGGLVQLDKSMIELLQAVSKPDIGMGIMFAAMASKFKESKGTAKASDLLRDILVPTMEASIYAHAAQGGMEGSAAKLLHTVGVFEGLLGRSAAVKKAIGASIPVTPIPTDTNILTDLGATKQGVELHGLPEIVQDMIKVAKAPVNLKAETYIIVDGQRITSGAFPPTAVTDIRAYVAANRLGQDSPSTPDAAVVEVSPLPPRASQYQTNTVWGDIMHKMSVANSRRLR